MLMCLNAEWIKILAHELDYQVHHRQVTEAKQCPAEGNPAKIVCQSSASCILDQISLSLVYQIVSQQWAQYHLS